MKRLLGLATVLVLATSSGASAECYPPDPSNGAGRVDRSRVAPGECVTFYGTGFRPKSDVAIADNGASRGTARADSSGGFATQVCFASDSQPGQHTLTGTGPDKGGDCSPNGPKALGVGFRAMAASAKPGDRTVSATVYVLGVGVVTPPNVGGENSGGPGGLPRTGDITLLESIVGLALVLFGAATLIAARPRRRSARTA